MLVCLWQKSTQAAKRAKSVEEEMASIIDSSTAELNVGEIWEEIKEKACAQRFTTLQDFQTFIDQNKQKWYKDGVEVDSDRYVPPPNPVLHSL